MITVVTRMIDGQALVVVWRNGKVETDATVFNVSKEVIEERIIDAIEGMLMEPDAFR